MICTLRSKQTFMRTSLLRPPEVKRRASIPPYFYGPLRVALRMVKNLTIF